MFALYSGAKSLRTGSRMRGRGSKSWQWRADTTQLGKRAKRACKRGRSSARMVAKIHTQGNKSLGTKGKLTVCARLGVAEPTSSWLRCASVAVKRELTPAEHADLSGDGVKLGSISTTALLSSLATKQVRDSSNNYGFQRRKRVEVGTKEKKNCRRSSRASERKWRAQAQLRAVISGFGGLGGFGGR